MADLFYRLDSVFIDVYQKELDVHARHICYHIPICVPAQTLLQETVGVCVCMCVSCILSRDYREDFERFHRGNIVL